MKNTYYLVVDLEATCEEKQKIPDAEIVEIGAVLLDSTLQYVDEFQTFVKPVINPILSDFCTKLTHIEQNDVDNAPTFESAYYRLEDWIDSLKIPNFQFVSWGGYDARQIQREAKRINLEETITQNSEDLKALFTKKQGLNRRVGVRAALDLCGKSFKGTPHRAIDDVRNIVDITPFILGEKKLPPTIISAFNKNKKFKQRGTKQNNRNEKKINIVIKKSKNILSGGST